MDAILIKIERALFFLLFLLFPKILTLLKEKGMNDVLLTGGGIIPANDMKKLNEMGVGELFPPGTTTTVIADYIKNWVKENRNF